MFAKWVDLIIPLTDCYNFHDAIGQEIVPIITSFEEDRKEKLGYAHYKPWDTKVDVGGLARALKPFKGGKQLTDLTIECFKRLRPYFGECIAIMQEMKHLDLESKDGKGSWRFYVSII